MRRFQAFGAATKEESARERAHRALARRAAAEGTVLLKNDGVLPLSPGGIALYGPGSRKTVKGGSGSGDVHERRSVNIEEGLRNAGFSFPTTLWMDRFSDRYARDTEAWRKTVEEAVRGYGPVRTMRMF
ncbi:MAG: glycoside hydrolase family 3 C-terminal domain-containing protein, partial [Oscillospiraceae bacterium]|nr:glycoside hydrolase family 3 C-terminal domain-containing protein [Oscillospiraceae bacterium]